MITQVVKLSVKQSSGENTRELDKEPLLNQSPIYTVTYQRRKKREGGKKKRKRKRKKAGNIKDSKRIGDLGERGESSKIGERSKETSTRKVP